LPNTTTQANVWSNPVTSGGITAVYRMTGPSGTVARAAAQQRSDRERLWVIGGTAMTFDQVVEELFPDDTPQKTRFLLKYAGAQP
jgi:hypothetical protein